MSVMCCRNCPCFEEIKRSEDQQHQPVYGSCRATPPAAGHIDTAVWPIVRGIDWCARHPAFPHFSETGHREQLALDAIGPAVERKDPVA